MPSLVRRLTDWFTGRKTDPGSAIRAWQQRYAQLHASYDAARTSTEYQNIWANADRLDADSANSRDVRHTLISRSRYEVGNNGYSDGIAQTYATDLVGLGPQLRMQTGSEAFNRMVESSWYLWCKAVRFRQKLWCMAHAKHVDGEAFAVLRRNPGVNHPIAIDVQLYEAEQIQTPYLPIATRGRIDGIEFDAYGNPQWYELLLEHPGAANRQTYGLETERIRAEFVLHWFKMRRPGQHRGVPEIASTLNVGAAARRWREATLAAAETAADFTLFLKTQFQPDSEEMQYASDFSQQEITKRMMTALPVGYDPFQMKAEHPNAAYAEFHKSLLNEQARPKSMPYNKAACDSSSYNYASGRLDHQTYYASLDVERDDGNDQVLDKTFSVWLDAAILRFGWLGGIPEAVGPAARMHSWDWPKHRVADVESEANANETRLRSGQIFPHVLYSDAGMDFEDELERAATSFGISVEELRARVLDVLLPPAQSGNSQTTEEEPAADMAAASVLEKLRGRNGHQLNGVGHAKEN